MRMGKPDRHSLGTYVNVPQQAENALLLWKHPFTSYNSERSGIVQIAIVVLSVIVVVLIGVIIYGVRFFINNFMPRW